MTGDEGLRGRHVLLLGVREGLGRAVAVALAEAGANVSVTTATLERAEEVAANSILNECWTFGREGQALRLDLEDLDAAAEAVERLEADVALLDAAVTLPCELDGSDVLEAGPDELRAAFDQSILPAFAAVRAVAPRMLDRGAGRVVFLVPRVADEPPHPLTVAVSEGLGSLARQLERLWRERGLTLHVLSVGVPPDEPSDEELAAIVAAIEGSP